MAYDNEFDSNMKLGNKNTEKYKKEDILNSLIYMISFNIGQLAYFTSVIHSINNVYFIGNYLKNHDLAM